MNNHPTKPIQFDNNVPIVIENRASAFLFKRMSHSIIYTLLLIIILTGGSGCYSFRGLTIDCNTTKTFSIMPFDNNAPNSPATLNQTFVELLRDKVLSETCLSSTRNEGDVQFSGEIVKYQVTSVAPTEGETNTTQRLTIGVAIEYINTTNEEENISKRYEWYEDYDSNVSLLSIQDELINTISEQILENIFNDAFTNW